jgi:diaminopimelate epimerase
MSMLKFTKMHGLGNDFIVIDAINQAVDLTESQIKFLADRQWGVGCDQLLLVESPSSPESDFKYRIFNSDGSEVEQCGNGARCFAKFVREKGLSVNETISVETASGIIYPTIQQNGEVTVDMGRPHLVPAEIPFNADQQSILYTLALEAGKSIQISAVSMGNPHAVTVVDDVELAPVGQLGPIIEQHSRFPERVNAGFMQVVSTREIKLRVYERGAGETLACGTGACAAVVSGIQQQLLERRVEVGLPGGKLTISWPDDQASVWMTGPATTVFDGEIAWATIQNY